MPPNTVRLLIALLALLLSACQQPAPTLPPATPTPQPSTPTTPPTATPVGLPAAPPERPLPLQPGLPLPSLPSGWTTFSVGRPVTALAQAADGTIWVGHEHGGYRFPAHAADQPWTPLAEEMAGAKINTFYPLPGGMWVGHEQGASFFHYASEEWTHIRPGVAPSAGLYRGEVQAMTTDGDGRIWFGTVGGVTVWDGQQFFYDDFLTVEERGAGGRPHFVYALLFDGANVWAGTVRGLFRYDAGYERTHFEPTKLLPDGTTPRVRALDLDGDGRLLLGVNQQLLRLQEDGEFRSLFTGDDEIHSITVTPDTIWLGLGNDRLLRGNDGAWQEASTGTSEASFRGRHVLLDYLGARWFAAESGSRLSRYVP